MDFEKSDPNPIRCHPYSRGGVVNEVYICGERPHA